MKNRAAKLRPVYDDIYHDLEKLIASSCYKKWLDSVSKHFEKFGVPFPEKPIPRDTCLCHPGEWTQQMNKKIQESLNSKEYKDAVYKIKGDKKMFVGEEECDSYQEVREKLLLFPLGEYVDFVIDNCTELNRFKNKKEWRIFREHIMGRILHGEKEYIPPFTVHWKRDESISNPHVGLYIEILPTTKRDDIVKNWNLIQENQKRLPGYKKNFRKKENIERDVRVMELYEKYKDKEYKKKTSLFVKIALDLENEGFSGVCFETITKVIQNNSQI